MLFLKYRVNNIEANESEILHIHGKLLLSCKIRWKCKVRLVMTECEEVVMSMLLSFNS